MHILVIYEMLWGKFLLMGRRKKYLTGFYNQVAWQALFMLYFTETNSRKQQIHQGWLPIKNGKLMYMF